MFREKKKPDVKEFFTNLSVPMPLTKKISLLIRNNTYKFLISRIVVVIRANQAADSHETGYRFGAFNCKEQL